MPFYIAYIVEFSRFYIPFRCGKFQLLKCRWWDFFEKVGAKLIFFDIIALEMFNWKEVVLCQQ